jgi:hypothetical protein
MRNIAELYHKHRPSGADDAMRRAMERAADNASRIAAAQERTSVAPLVQRQMDAAAKIAQLLWR